MAHHSVFYARTMSQVRELIEKAVGKVGSEAELGKKAGGFSQNAIWQAKRRNSVTAEMALGIHHATAGEVPASDLRPDLWAHPEDVPPLQKEDDAA